MPLRVDQEQSLSSAQGHFDAGARGVLLVNPTGTGKTYTAAHYMQRSIGRGMFIVHRRPLLEQTSDRLRDHGIAHGVMYGGRHENLHERIIVASSQTLVRRRDALAGLSWAIIDEAHRGEHAKVVEELRRLGVRYLGLTATPQRGSKGLAHEYDAMVVGVGYPEAVAGGLIVPPRIYAPVRPSTKGVRISKGEYMEADAELVMHRLMSDILGAWAMFCQGKRALGFCVNVKHAHDTAAAISGAGGVAYVIHADTPDDERKDILAAWRFGPPSTLLNVAVFAEGYDAPECQVVLNMALTRSPARFLQTCGRGCRTAPGKTHYVLVDCAGAVFDHGSPAAHREWSLEEGEVRTRSPRSTFKVCQKCFAAYEGSSCELCGYVPVASVNIKTVSAQLQEVSADLQPAAEAGLKKRKEDTSLEMTDMTRLRRRLYATLAPKFREPMLTQRVKDDFSARVSLRFAGGHIMVPRHIALLW